MKEKISIKSDNESKARVAYKISTISIVVNILLSAFKILAGIVSNSAAMVSDGIHSISDIFSTVVVIIGVKISAKEADRDHPYGHERLEAIAAILLSIVLLLTGLGIGIEGIKKIIEGNYGRLAVPGVFALIMAILSIGIKEGMYWLTRNASLKINSDALMADAWHHRSDALSSGGALLGIVGARMGFPILDSVAALIICVFIIKVSYDIFKGAVKKLVDHACDEETVEKIMTLVGSQQGVERIDLLDTRIFGSKIYVDIEIAADGELSLHEAHGIAKSVHDSVEREFPMVKHCMVHVNPMES